MAALVVAVCYPWLPGGWRLLVVLPVAAVAFAVSGARMAHWLDASPHQPERVVGARLLRVLTPFWVMALVLVPTMLARGWGPATGEDPAAFWARALLWVLPAAVPPASAEGAVWFALLWFLSTLVVLVLLAPVSLWLFRRWRKATLALPFAVLLLNVSGLLALEGGVAEVVRATLLFAPSWLVGCAHHDGWPGRTWRWLAAGAAFLASGIAWAWWHRDPIEGWDFLATPLAGALVGAGVSLLVLAPASGRVRRTRPGVLGTSLGVVASRALTVYLWAGAVAWTVPILLGRWESTAGLAAQGPAPGIAGTVLVLTLLFATVGVLEDLAGGRRPDRGRRRGSAPAVVAEGPADASAPEV